MILVIVVAIAIVFALFAFVRWTFGAGAVEASESPIEIPASPELLRRSSQRAMAIPRKVPSLKTRSARSL